MIYSWLSFIELMWQRVVRREKLYSWKFSNYSLCGSLLKKVLTQIQIISNALSGHIYGLLNLKRNNFVYPVHRPEFPIFPRPGHLHSFSFYLKLYHCY